MSTIETRIDLELTLEHHHGAERVPMEPSGVDGTQLFGERAFGSTRTYVCTKCKQRVTLDLVGATQTIPPLVHQAKIVGDAE
jgi:hypothetical protein